MKRRVIIKVTHKLLEELLKLPRDISILGTSETSQECFLSDAFYVKLGGEGLPEKFATPEGALIQHADPIITEDGWEF